MSPVEWTRVSSGKSKRSSRRSSILKVKKPCQPLQNVEPNESSVEDSPESTKKIKRRVSFAEKKHVKEFCDSMEQGTVWDNTYEESELSQRNSQNSNSDENCLTVESAIQLSYHDSQVDIASNIIHESIVRESIVTSIKLRDSLLVNSENSRVAIDANWKPTDCNLEISEMIVGTVHPETIGVSFPVNPRESLKASQFRLSADEHIYLTRPNEISDTLGQQSLSNIKLLPTVIGEKCNNVPMDETIIEAASAVLTAPISMSKDVAHGSSATLPINTLDPLPNENSKSNAESLTTVKESATQSKFTVFQDDSMEMTDVMSDLSKLPSTKCIIMKSNEESTLVAAEKPMFQISTRKSAEPAKDRTKADLQSKISIFHDKSMDITEVVPVTRNIEPTQMSPTSKTTVFHNKSVDFTNVIEGLLGVNELPNIPPEKTTIFQNESVDFTQIVENVPRIGKSQELPSERTTIFHNESLVLTEVVPVVSMIKKSIFDNSESTEAIIKETVETENRKIPQNIQSSGVAEAISKMSNISNSISHEGIRSFNETIGKATEICASTSQEPHCKATDSENHSPLPKRFKSLGNNPIDVIAAQTNLEMQQSKKLFDAKSTTPECLILESASVLPSNMQFSEKPHISDIHDKLQDHNQSMEMTEIAPSSYRNVLNSDRIVPPSDSNLIKPVLNDCNDTNHGDELIAAQNTTLINDESMEITCTIPGTIRSMQYKVEANPMITRIHDQSMEMTVPVSTLAIGRKNAIVGETCSSNDGGAKTAVFSNDFMEMTVPVSNLAIARKNAIVGETCSSNDGGAKTAVFSNDFMEMTVPVSNLAIARKNAILGETGNSYAGEAKTTVFSDDSMDLTKAVQYSSNVDREIQPNKNEYEKAQSIGPVKFGNEDRTVVFNDDGMELTSAMQFVSQPTVPIEDKENCPVGVDNRFCRRRLSCRAQIFEPRKRNVAASANEWPGMSKPNEFPLSEENKENIAVPRTSQGEKGASSFETEDITGVVPFLTEIEETHTNEGEKHCFEEDCRSLALGDVEMQITGIEPWSSNPSNLQSRKYSSISPRLDRPSDEIETHRRSGQVVKELFEKTTSNSIIGVDEKIKSNNPNDITGIADIEAVIKKLADSFAVEDESGFDQATFLRQQARCMEDYEANSTASQECNSTTPSAKIDEPITPTKAEFRDSPKFNATANSVGNHDVSIVENHRFASKSLEELRCRADTLSKFQLEATVMLEDLQTIEPPSIALEDSITIGRSEVVQCTMSGHELSSRHIVFSKNMDHKKLQEANETVLQELENVPDVLVDMPEITMTQTVHMENIVNDKNNECTVERMERKKMHRSETIVKQRISDVTGLSTATSEIENETTKNRRSLNTGLTTASEFTSESPDGPSDKLRRRENIRDIEIENEQLKKLTKSWECKDFASSTGICDFLRKPMHRGTEESSVILDDCLSEEMPSAIVENDERNVSASIQIDEVANNISMEAEVVVNKSPFAILKETIEDLAARFETIWTINRLDEQIVAFNFFSNSIVLAIYFNNDEDAAAKPIKVIGFLSQLIEDGTDPGVSLAHSLIMKKIDSASLSAAYTSYEDIPQMLDYVSTEIKFGMDFMFELDRLRDRNVMEINKNRVTFMVRTTDINAGIILNVTIEIKLFEEINCNDITVSYILGKDKVRDDDIKRLITNVKRDPSFLRFYMNDVKDYVDLMAETGFSTRTERTGIITKESIC